ncbi:hypothetical protein C9439_03705 [archaeon SCG-AAA382B04]|nr:hypothetical protein C9439_03705 [archaeon SCG-AAA382B04]
MREAKTAPEIEQEREQKTEDDLIDEANKLIQQQENEEQETKQKEEIEDTWECLRCGREFELKRGVKPVECENCERKGPFEAKTGPLQFFDGQRFQVKKLADEITENYSFVMHRRTQEIYVYDNGIYVPNAKTFVREYVRKRLDDRVRRSYVNEAVEHIKETNFVDQERFNKNKTLLHCQNAMLDLDKILGLDKSASELEIADIIAAKKDFTPEIVSTTKINANPHHNPNDRPEKIVNFLEDVVGEDQIKLIQEMIGYCLIKDYPGNKAFMLLGEGENGKSTLLNLIQKFLGKKSVAHVSLQDLVRNRFRKIDLYGKLANLFADLAPKKLAGTTAFKMATGQDSMAGETKNVQKKLHFTNHAKLIYSANQLPHIKTKNATYAFFRRWIPIDFPYKFTDDPNDGNPQKDPDKLDKITTQEQLDKLLTWSIKGLKRFMDNGKFSTSTTTEDIEDRWLMQTSSIFAFFNRAIEEHKDATIQTKKIFSAYGQWAQENDIQPKDNSVVGRKVLNSFPTVEKERRATKHGSGREQTYVGIRFKKSFKQKHKHLKVFKENNNENNADNGTRTLEGYSQDKRIKQFKKWLNNKNNGTNEEECMNKLRELGAKDPEQDIEKLLNKGTITLSGDGVKYTE